MRVPVRICAPISLLLAPGCVDKTDALDIRFESPAAFCALLLEQRIQHDARCVGGLEAYFRRYWENQFEPGFCADLSAAVEAGDLQIDDKKAAECLELLGAGECDRWSWPGTPCDEAVLGRREAGEHCDLDWELCGPDVFCDECTSTCMLRLGVDEPCVYNAQCESGLACTTNDVCEKPGRSGEPCTARQWCEPGLVCNDEECRPPKEENETCAAYLYGWGCGESLRCIASDGAFEGICLAPASVGQSCVEGQCREPSFCEGGVCVLPPFIGEVCTEQCVEGVCFEGLCSDYRQVGETCEPYQCADGWCDQGVCVEAIPVGEPCETWEQCGVDAYCGGICISWFESSCE